MHRLQTPFGSRFKGNHVLVGFLGRSLQLLLARGSILWPGAGLRAPSLTEGEGRTCRLQGLASDWRGRGRKFAYRQVNPEPSVAVSCTLLGRSWSVSETGYWADGLIQPGSSRDPNVSCCYRFLAPRATSCAPCSTGGLLLLPSSC